MNNKQYNINNSLIRKYKKIYPSAKVKSKNISKSKLLKFINETKNQYTNVECSIVFYEENLYRHNWIDIEGMGYGWIWYKRPKNKWRKSIVEFFKNNLYAYEINKEFKFIFVQDEEFLIIHIPSRTTEMKADIIFKMSKENCRKYIYCF